MFSDVYCFEPGQEQTGEAVEIETGAPLPEAANAVVKREESSLEDGAGVETGDPGVLHDVDRPEDL